MQEKIAERIDALVAERRRNSEVSAVDHRASRRGDDVADVAEVAADSVEKVTAGDGVRRGGQSRVTRRRLGRAHEAGEYFDVLTVILGVGDGVDSGDRIAVRGVLGRLQWTGDAHLIQVRVGG